MRRPYRIRKGASWELHRTYNPGTTNIYLVPDFETAVYLKDDLARTMRGDRMRWDWVTSTGGVWRCSPRLSDPSERF